MQGLKLPSSIRWPIQVKLVALVLIALVATVSAVIWKTQSLVLDDKIGFITDSNVKQMAPLRKLVELRLNEEKDQLLQLAVNRGSNTTASKNLNFGTFDVVSLMQPQAGEANQWAPSWTEHSATARPERWPAGFDLTLLKSLAYSRVKNGEVLWYRLSDRQGLPIYAMMISVEVPRAGGDGLTGAASESAQLGQNESPLPETTADNSATAKGKGATSIGQAQSASGGQKAVLVGFASGNPLATLTEEFVGSINGVFIVDDKGYVAAHNNRAFLGALFSEDPLVQEIMKTQKAEGGGRFEDLESQKILAHYERIDGSNLYAVITTPMAMATGFADTHFRMALIAATAAGLMALLLAWLVGQNLSDAFARLSLAVQNVIRGGSPSNFQVIHTPDEMGDLSTQIAEAFRVVSNEQPPSQDAVLSAAEDADSLQEDGPSKKQPPPTLARTTHLTLASDLRASEFFKEGVEEIIKQPLMAILGHVQLTRAKSEDADVRSHVDSIEREVRLISDSLTRLAEFGQSIGPVDESDQMHLDQVVREAADQFEPELVADGGQLVLQIATVPPISGSATQIRAAVLHILENAREALHQRKNRKVTVALRDEAAHLVLEISDTGIGMSRDIQERIFEPFYKNFENPARLGLGLAYVASAVKRIGATYELDSSPGEGSSFRLSFLVSSAERAAFNAANSIAAQPADEEIDEEIDEDDVQESIFFAKTSKSVEPSPTPAGGPPPLLRLNLDLPEEVEEPEVTTTRGGTAVLGGKQAIFDDDKTAFPPAPQAPAGPPTAPPLSPPQAASVSAEASDSGEAKDAESLPPAGASLSNPAPAPATPKSRSPRDERISSALNSIAAASAAFDDDDDEVFSNVALGKTGRKEPDANAAGTSSGSADADTGSGFKVKIRRPRLKS
jgi:signal transduction histidine kinase